MQFPRELLWSGTRHTWWSPYKENVLEVNSLYPPTTPLDDLFFVQMEMGKYMQCIIIILIYIYVFSLWYDSCVCIIIIIANTVTGYSAYTDLLSFGHVFEIVIGQSDTLVDDRRQTATAPGGRRAGFAERRRRRTAARERSFAGRGRARGQRFGLLATHDTSCGGENETNKQMN